MKKALVVDWLDKYGGAERVISSLTSIFDFDTCYTLVNQMEKEDLKKVFSHKKIKIYTTILNNFGSRFRFLFFLFPYFVKKIYINPKHSLIVSSSFSIAKGVKKTSPNQIHICYIQARNQRYLWDKDNIYFSKFLHTLISPVLLLLKKFDIKQASSPDFLIANSKFIQNWIKINYKRNSEVIYPPVDVKKFRLEKSKDNYFITASRLEPYKRVDLIVKAFNRMNEKLIILGSGSQLKFLKKIANKNIEFIDFSDSSVVFDYVSKAKAFVHAGIEDFGIAPVEAQACGTPVIGLKKAGLLETVIENKTGVFFNDQSEDAILNAIERFKNIDFDPEVIRNNALRFSKENFENQFKNFCKKKLNK
jgi:glycosyltransferase involved in cell wall biosynthesis